MFDNPHNPHAWDLPYPAPELAAGDVAWTVGELCSALQAERAANAALLALCFRLSAALDRQSGTP
jgi:hypothetical protein